jgi:hypothetical protein
VPQLATSPVKWGLASAGTRAALAKIADLDRLEALIERL